MTFTITYRGRDGALREETTEAANRAECIAGCKMRGIALIGIREGSAYGKRSLSKHRPFFIPVSLFVATVGLSTIFWWLNGHETGHPAERPKAEAPLTQPKPTSQSKSAPKPAVESTAPAAAASTPEATTNLKWDDSFTTNREMRIKFSVLAAAWTNDSGVITERYRLPNGKFWRRQIDPPPIFTNASDNAIAMALGDRSGAPIPPFPGLHDANLDEEFLKSLAQPIVINEDDKPWLVAMKTAVKEAREEIARRLKAGDTRSVGEMLRDHVQENNRTAHLQGEALAGYRKMLETDGKAAAAEYLEKVNEALSRFGIAPVNAVSQENEKKRGSR